jgi:hypothetical protein
MGAVSWSLPEVFRNQASVNDSEVFLYASQYAKYHYNSHTPGDILQYTALILLGLAILSPLLREYGGWCGRCLPSGIQNCLCRKSVKRSDFESPLIRPGYLEGFSIHKLDAYLTEDKYCRRKFGYGLIEHKSREKLEKLKREGGSKGRILEGDFCYDMLMT